jgi:tetraacyldisaccharide 4'-kinase
VRAFVEAMWLSPRWYHWLLILVLTPFSLIYGIVAHLRRKYTTRHCFGVPIISVGNLMVGGTGKTPFVIALASYYQASHVMIISRGYGRKSRGLVVVSQKGVIETSVQRSGDEAMLMARSLPYASVVVSEDRKEAIALAIEQGVDMVLLDDGFSQVGIEKFEILLEPQKIRNPLPFPAGAFREFAWMKRHADLHLVEGEGFVRRVYFENLKERMLLVSAIANPQRLDPYLPKGVVGRYYLDDHAYFDEVSLQNRIDQSGVETLLVTQKDAVKMEGFKLPLSLMKLELTLDESIFSSINRYIKEVPC